MEIFLNKHIIHNFDKNLANNQSLWRCQTRECRGNIILDTNREIIHFEPHTMHRNEYGKILRRFFYMEIDKRITSTDVDSGRITSECTSIFKTVDLLHLPDRKYCNRRINDIITSLFNKRIKKNQDQRKDFIKEYFLRHVLKNYKLFKDNDAFFTTVDAVYNWKLA